ncbi:NAD(P)H-dependent glycerol-3-phosphate dehydrogenase [Acidihalobacter prosperus]|uniref:Glycerol-3-phosphate dehydrogenase [NAD(P)+] n=1 Tax=Acidihalobacter prosperus TaxID=160660 RepID=A0A1A6C4B5_9GAMM|nr:NAD(P)H-dependent glycerol-3-phosphate dehydrogenase [Acidihalobacter prosperus]OBS09394.1 Glycerol-3-phosphate dehydrogenase [NAD(P)+] [Acidihalobacter prosperus]
MQGEAPLAVLGAGSWGTAVAVLLAGNGRPCLLWCRDPTHAADMAASRRNARYLGDIELPAGLTPTADLDHVLARARDLVLAIPSAGFPEFVEGLRGRLPDEARLAWLTKGLAHENADTLDRVVARVLGDDRPRAVISGPSFAAEVARGQPTAVTVASPDPAYAEMVAGWLRNAVFRVYTSDDMLGVELGGALKNVLAIAVGISDGLGYGANARAALITRGLAELMRLFEAAGARPETLMGLSGLGDLVLTCTDDQSRNRRLGLALGRGETLAAARRAIGQVVEGATTAEAVMRVAQRYGVELPICEQVYRVIHEGVPAPAAVQALLARDPRPELGASFAG